MKYFKRKKHVFLHLYTCPLCPRLDPPMLTLYTFQPHGMRVWILITILQIKFII